MVQFGLLYLLQEGFDETSTWDRHSHDFVGSLFA